MSFNTLGEFRDAVFKLLLKDATVQSLSSGVRGAVMDLPSSKLLIRHYKKGGIQGYSEHKEVFPVMSVQPFPPELNREIGFGKPYFIGGFIDGQANMIFFPTPAVARYQISVATLNEADQYEFQDWLYRTFEDFGQIILNPIETDLGTIGSPVEYKLKTNGFSGRDDVFETTYDLTFKPFIHLKVSEQLDAVEEIKIRMSTLYRGAITHKDLLVDGDTPLEIVDEADLVLYDLLILSDNLKL